MKNYSYSKESQIARTFRRHRDPVALRALFSLRMPTSEAESAAERYGRCAVPGCPSYGTLDRPLDLHHVVPRSQSRALIDDFTNHLYLCGDWFPRNHHKAIHGENTPGKEDWIRLGIFNDLFDGINPCDVEPKMATLEDIKKFEVFAKENLIAANILFSDPDVFFEYSAQVSNTSPGITVTAEQLQSLKNIVKETRPWNPIQRILKKQTP